MLAQILSLISSLKNVIIDFEKDAKTSLNFILLHNLKEINDYSFSLGSSPGTHVHTVIISGSVADVVYEEGIFNCELITNISLVKLHISKLKI